MRATLTASMAVAAVLCVLVHLPARASTAEAWAAHEETVVKACVAASGLANARPAGKVMEFDDRVGYSAIVIRGTYPQPHMKKHPARVLCLFDRTSRQPFVTGADDIDSRK